MPAPSLCTITGTLRKANGAVWPNGQLMISRAASTSQVLGGTSVIITADASGAVSFSLVQGSIVTISGAFVIGKDSGVDYDFSRGLRIFVPVQSSATLETLKTIEDELAAISAPTTDAIEVQEAGVSLGSFTALNFATGATVTDAGGGVADVDITGGGGGGSVSSVFGRTGAVVAVTNDYTFAQIDKTTSSLADLTTRSASDLSSGTLPDARFPATLPALSGANLTALSASNLASGTVPLARLSGITNTEIDAAAAIAYSKLNLTGAILNADLAGSIANAKLANSSVTIGSTSVSLGGTAATVAGLTLTTPTIASFTNATHDHSNAAGGGQIAISAGIGGLGTGVATALGVNVGSAGAPVLFNGAGGTPSSLTLTSATGLPPTTGISGWPANSSGVLTNNGSGTLSWAAAGSGLTVGTTAIASGTGGRLFYETAGNVLGEISGATSDGTAVTFGSGNLLATSPQITTGINDSAGNEIFLFTATGSAINELTIANASIGTNPSVTASGGDTNIGITLTPKGTGAIVLGRDGVAATPAIAFASSANTGFVRDTASQLGIVVSGVEIIAAGSSQVKFMGGVNFATAFSASSDVGFIRGAAGVVRVSNGGSAGTGAGSLVLGTSTVGSIGTSGVGVLAIANGTAPSSSPADEFQLYAADSAAGASNAFIRNELGEINRISGLSAINTSSFAKTTDTTLANITGLSRNVEAGRTYAFTATMQTTAAATGGVKFAVSGTATATSIRYEGVLQDATVTVAQTRATALDTVVCASTTSTAGTCTIKGVVVINSGGTLTLQFAQNASDGGASTVLVNQYFQLIPIS